ncbi:MAG: hypothetical protein ACRD6X_09395 [Pyrinomonadaceae bacterium]
MSSHDTYLGLVTFVLMLAVSGQMNGQGKGSGTKNAESFYAVLGDGKRIEPIGIAVNGKFPDEQNMTESSIPEIKARSTFSLIFGSSQIGILTVTSKASGECSGDSGEVSIRPPNSKLRGFVMALATDAKPRSNTTGFRRTPTAAERSSVEKLIRGMYAKENVPAAASKVLRSHNLTAIDVDRDGKAELVGTYIATPKKDERALLFFIAARKKDGTYGFEYSEFERATPENVMSGEVKDLDDGTVGNELLLDLYDVDGDGIAEIFTTGQAFEGRNFYVYGRTNGKWNKVFSSYNYRCGY